MPAGQWNTQDDLAAAMNSKVPLLVVKASQTSEGAGTFHSLWKAAGAPPAGANPPAANAGGGYVPTRATAGAFNFSNPADPALSKIGRLDLAIATIGSPVIADRLWHCSGFGTVSTSLQSVTTPGALPAGRDPYSGADCEPWLEVYTAPGANAATWTVTGTDANGNTGRTWVYSHPANAESVGQMMQLLPGGASPATTLGIRQVDSFQASGSSGTAGDVGVTVLRRLARVACQQANVPFLQDYAQLGLPQVYNDACLFLFVLCSATNTGLLQGGMDLWQH